MAPTPILHLSAPEADLLHGMLPDAESLDGWKGMPVFCVLEEDGTISLQVSIKSLSSTNLLTEFETSAVHVGSASQTLLAANALRRYWCMDVPLSVSGNVLIGVGFAPSSGKYTYRIPPGQSYESPSVLGGAELFAILDDGSSGIVMVSEGS